MRAAVAVAALLSLAPSVVYADEFEASVGARATGGMARLDQEGAREAASVPAGGVALGVTYGLRNWLALDAQLDVSALGTARYDVMTSAGGGQSMPKTIDRSARTSRLTVGATLRGGVAWIPTLSLGVGAQARWQTAGLVVSSGLDNGSVADGYDDSIGADVIAAARIGLDRRLGRRWIINASVGVVHAIPIGGPAFDLIEASVGASCYRYPLW